MSQDEPIDLTSRSRRRFCKAVADLLEIAATARQNGRFDNQSGDEAADVDTHDGGFGRNFEFNPDVGIDKAAFLDCDDIYRAASHLCHRLSAPASGLVGLEGALNPSNAASRALFRVAVRQLVETFVDVKAKEYGFIRTSDNVECLESAVLLEQAFAVSPTPNPAEVEVLGWATQMGEQRVTEWFTRKADKVKQLAFLRRTVQAALDTVPAGAEGEQPRPVANGLTNTDVVSTAQTPKEDMVLDG